MLHLPTALLMGSVGARVYSEYQAHIAGRATGGVVGFGSLTTGLAAGLYRTTPTAGAQSMTGTSWQGVFSRSDAVQTYIRTVVLHGLPSVDVYSDLLVSGREVLISINAIASWSDFLGRTRNGFTSTTALLTAPAAQLLELIWHDGERPWRSRPYTSQGPEPYDW
ncbi:hypothetical protein [uncultured Brevundimonas sp.]|uniref:hypothetical protein n=1 Tax=uncultured Brevundimonas sp. TaxID=213418 RepID=UPI00260CA29A|nr:hypothetical protein [uncultured Brevundimonas sp.]